MTPPLQPPTRPGTRFTPMGETLPDICGACDMHRRYHDAEQCLGIEELRQVRRSRRGDG